MNKREMRDFITEIRTHMISEILQYLEEKEVKKFFIVLNNVRKNSNSALTKPEIIGMFKKETEAEFGNTETCADILNELDMIS